jgi:hypothetical protein
VWYRDEGVNKITGEVNWLKAGPYRMEIDNASDRTCITGAEYLNHHSAFSRGFSNSRQQ